MINTNKKSLLFILSLVLLLAGCSKQDKKVTANFNNRPSDFEQTKDNVKVGTKFLSNKEFNVFFKSPSLWVRKVSSKDYQAIQLNIDNLSTNSYSIDKNCTQLKMISPEEMIELLKANAVARGIAGITFFSAAGIFVGYSIAMVSLVFVFVQSVFNPSKATMFAIGAIPLITLGTGIYLGVKSYTDTNKKNKRLKNKILNQSQNLNKEITINSNEKFSTMIFVKKKDLKKEFDFSLQNPTTKNVALNFEILVPEHLLCTQ